MRFKSVKETQAMLPTERLCQIMNVSPCGYRAYRSGPISRRQREDMVLLAHIREQHRLSLQSYGRPRMTEELKEIGIDVGHRRVGRLMRQNNISVIRTRKHKVTTDSNHKFNIAPNLLNRNFVAGHPNQKWVVSNRMKRDLAIRAWDMAVALRKPPRGCIHHSDRGSQYCSHDYQKHLRQHGFKISMSGKGNCYNNAAMETFFKTCLRSAPIGQI